MKESRPLTFSTPLPVQFHSNFSLFEVTPALVNMINVAVTRLATSSERKKSKLNENKKKSRRRCWHWSDIAVVDNWLKCLFVWHKKNRSGHMDWQFVSWKATSKNLFDRCHNLCIFESFLFSALTFSLSPEFEKKRQNLVKQHGIVQKFSNRVSWRHFPPLKS